MRAMVLLSFLAALSAVSTPSSAAGLTFEQRVEAQRAIERVYYSHRIGAHRSFAEAVPRRLLEKKVRTYLRESAALDRIWSSPITAEALRREMARIEAGTRMPERLTELYAALGNDAFLIQETLVRASLADRLTRSFLAGSNEAAWERASRSLDDLPVPAVATPAHPYAAPRPGAAAQECVRDDTWDNGILDAYPAARVVPGVWTGTELFLWGGSGASGALGDGSRYDADLDTWRRVSSVDAPAAREGHTIVWTGSVAIVWGGSANTGGRYDPATDSWAPTTTTDAPSPRSGHTAIWTGDEMIVWGYDSGGRYDPVSDSWRAVAPAPLPGSRILHTAVWTGSEMIVWGGIASDGSQAVYGDGARYDPLTDTWLPVGSTGAPSARYAHTSVWTGTEMIVWGGSRGAFGGLNDGARYDPASDAWTAVTTLGAPDPRQDHTAVWTGARMIVWGGVNLPCCDRSEPRDSGGLYDPDTDSWTPTSSTGAPYPRDHHIAVWTGDRMVVWGGELTVVSVLNGTTRTPLATGARYDPVTDTWTPTSTLNAPPGGAGHTTIWTGSLMIDWGGAQRSNASIGPGGRYDPALDLWTPTSSLGAPSSRTRHTAVWTGDEMIVWGGAQFDYLGDGRRYDPVADTWAPITDAGAPTPRAGHTAIWTGSRMIVWGGADASGRTDTGGLYDPMTDTWAPMSALGAPQARADHETVWTGTEMLVWGGRTGYTTLASTGGRYDPGSDTWTPISTVDAPSARYGHTAIWTDTGMAVWGGRTATGVTGSGALYDPVADSWTAISMVDAPSVRESHSAVWTGKVMVVWGGSGQRTGGRYDPVAESWTPTSLIGAPSERSGHNAVWTGTQMLIWGGVEYSGGRYGLDQSPDEDGDGFTTCQGDCDDTDPAVNPLAVDLPGDRIDQNCDGVPICDPDAAWKNRGRFVSCVARECHRLVEGGLLGPGECSSLVSKAARGVNQKGRPMNRNNDPWPPSASPPPM